MAKIWGQLERAQVEPLSSDPSTTALIGRVWFNTTSNRMKIVDNAAAVQTFIFAGIGQIVNADVSASAAIAGTKISPNFGSQNVLTTGSGTFNSVVVGSAANTISAVTTLVNGSGTLTLPTSTDTLVGRATTDTLTNKTLTSPVIGTIVNTGTLTLPTATTTLVGTGTTDTLTNKTISGSSNTLSNIADGSLTSSYLKADGTRALTGDWSAGSFKVGFGGASNSATIVRVGTINPLTGASQYAVETGMTGTSAATSQVCGFISFVNTAAAAFTCALLAQFYASDNGIGSGSTVTRYAMYLADVPSAGTNQAVLADNQTWTGNYFINSTTSNPTFIKGALTHGSFSGVGLAQAFTGFTVTPASMSVALTTTNAEGFSVEGAFPATATNSVTGFNSAATTTASAYTLSVLEHFVANNPSAGAGSTITRHISFRCVPPTSGTNNACFTDNSSFTGNYFVHQSGTTNSVFGGSIYSNDGNGSGTSVTNCTFPFIAANNDGTTNNWAGYGFTDGSGPTSSINAIVGCQMVDRTNHYGLVAIATRGAGGFLTGFQVDSSQICTANVGLQFGVAGTPSGYTPTTMSHYMEGTFTANFNAGAGTGVLVNGSITCTYRRVGKMVTLMFVAGSLQTGTTVSQSISTATSTIPSHILPTALVNCVAWGYVNSVLAAQIVVSLTTGGAISIFKSDNSNWSTSNTNLNGPVAFQMTYYI